MARGSVEVIVHPARETAKPFGERSWGRDRKVKRCIVAPNLGERAEDESGPTRTVSSGLQLVMPASTFITADDEVTVFGTRYAVDGEPVALRKKSGRIINVLVFLTKTRGG